MKRRQINIKDNKGFTMVDLVIALTIFTIFTIIISTLMYSSFKTNLQIKMSGISIYYAMQILEDIDKISYADVKNGIENTYISKFSIPSGFTINLDVSNYNEGNSKNDLIKKVKLTILYEVFGETESIVINKLKIKEI